MDRERTCPHERLVPSSCPGEQIADRHDEPASGEGVNERMASHPEMNEQTEERKEGNNAGFLLVSGQELINSAEIQQILVQNILNLNSGTEVTRFLFGASDE